MEDKENYELSLYFDTDYPQIDTRSTKLINEEINLSLLGLLGYNYKDAMKYIKENNTLTKKLNSKLQNQP